mmetsp:Transcript_10871/g.26642  ORF Transcript_10871/g.26642 Transcript_10871/m.26642 type:complete len:622 (+) Transcript_10871:51-1916(+)
MGLPTLFCLVASAQVGAMQLSYQYQGGTLQASSEAERVLSLKHTLRNGQDVSEEHLATVLYGRVSGPLSNVESEISRMILGLVRGNILGKNEKAKSKLQRFIESYNLPCDFKGSHCTSLSLERGNVNIMMDDGGVEDELKIDSPSKHRMQQRPFWERLKQYLPTQKKMQNYVPIEGEKGIIPRFEKDTISHDLREKLRGKHLRIRSVLSWLPTAGFMTYPLFVLNQLRVAHKLGLIGDKKPFVYMPEPSHYFDAFNSGPDPEFWKRWFHPIAEVDPKEVKNSDIWEFSQATIGHIHHHVDSVHSYPYSHANGTRFEHNLGTEDWIECQRDRARPLMSYINLREDLVEEARRFYSDHLKNATQVIGFHARGTDKWINRKVPPGVQIRMAKDFVKKHPNAKIFLATEDPTILTKYKTEIGNALVVRPAAQDPGNILYDDEVDRSVKAKDVILDSLILGMSDVLVKSWSAVPEYAVYCRLSGKLESPNKKPLIIVDMQLEAPGVQSNSNISNAYCGTEKDFSEDKHTLMNQKEFNLKKLERSPVDQNLACDAEVKECKSLCVKYATKVEGICLSKHLSSGSYSCYISNQISATNPCDKFSGGKDIRIDSSCANAYVNGATTQYF